MSLKKNYFVHWNGSPDIVPFSDYLVEFGLLKFSGTRPKSHEMHFHEGIEFHFVVKGTYQWRVENRCYQIFPGDGFITCPWEWHGSRDSIIQRGELAWMIIQPRLFDRKGNLDLGSWSSIDPEIQMEIGRIFAQNVNPILPREINIIGMLYGMNEELVHKELGYRTRINLLLDTLLVDTARTIKRRSENEAGREDFSKKLLEMMSEQFYERQTVDEMAYHFGMSVSSFNERVKKVTGFSPADYLIELRIEKAKKLLKESGHSIIYIAHECGFSSSQYFARLFSKRTGMNPTVFRKSAKT